MLVNVSRICILSNTLYALPSSHSKGLLLTSGKKATDEIEFRERENSGFSLRRSSFIYRYLFFFLYKERNKDFPKAFRHYHIVPREKKCHNYAVDLIGLHSSQ